MYTSPDRTKLVINRGKSPCCQFDCGSEIFWSILMRNFHAVRTCRWFSARLQLAMELLLWRAVCKTLYLVCPQMENKGIYISVHLDSSFDRQLCVCTMWTLTQGRHRGHAALRGRGSTTLIGRFSRYREVGRSRVIAWGQRRQVAIRRVLGWSAPCHLPRHRVIWYGLEKHPEPWSNSPLGGHGAMSTWPVGWLH